MSAIQESKVIFLGEEKHGFPRTEKPFWQPSDRPVTILGIANFEVNNSPAKLIYVEGANPIPGGICKDRKDCMSGNPETAFADPKELMEKLRDYI